jgi:hypothetical protein
MTRSAAKARNGRNGGTQGLLDNESGEGRIVRYSSWDMDEEGVNGPVHGLVGEVVMERDQRVRKKLTPLLSDSLVISTEVVSNQEATGSIAEEKHSHVVPGWAWRVCHGMDESVSGAQRQRGHSQRFEERLHWLTRWDGD